MTYAIYTSGINENPMKDRVLNALERYRNNTLDCSAGYDILRFVEKNLINISDDVDPQIFINWYPSDQAYIILRLAKQNKLSYKEQ